MPCWVGFVSDVACRCRAGRTAWLYLITFVANAACCCRPGNLALLYGSATLARAVGWSAGGRFPKNRRAGLGLAFAFGLIIGVLPRSVVLQMLPVVAVMEALRVSSIAGSAIAACVASWPADGRHPTNLKGSLGRAKLTLSIPPLPSPCAPNRAARAARCPTSSRGCECISRNSGRMIM